MNVDTLIKQMGGKAVPQGMSRESTALKTGDLHTLSDHVPNRAFMHGTIRNVPFKQILLGAILPVVMAQILENEFRKNGESVLASFPLHHFDLHARAVDVLHFQ